MTDHGYAPEGALLGTAENTYYTASPHALERAMAQGRILEGVARMCDCTDMRLHLELGGARAVIDREEAAYSHDGAPVKDIAVITRVGKPVCFKVLSVSREGGAPLFHLSRRAAQEECMKNFILRLRPGDIVPTKVTHLEPFGAFVDVGCGIVSLLSVDSISVSRIAHPSDRLSPGERIPAVVKSIDAASGRVTVTHRELLGTWEENAAVFTAAQTVPGIVRSIEPYGIFVELAPNLAGLAEVRGGVAVGDRCAVYIKSIIPQRMKVKLVIIDAHTEAAPARLRYFVDPSVTHLSRWRYSPPGCPKTIETDFDGQAGA